VRPHLPDSAASPGTGGQVVR